MSDDLNPYAAPTTEGAGASEGEHPSVRLFNPAQVVVAAFLGSAVAGATLIAVNEWKLGRGQRAWWVLLGGAGLFGIVVASTVVLPDFTGLPVGAASAIATAYAAQSLTGKEVEDHVVRGIPRASSGAAIGWALVGLTSGLAMIVVVSFVLGAVGAI